MWFRCRFIIAFVFSLIVSLPALAHFQLMYSGDSMLHDKASKIELDMMFSHPGSSAFIMPMAKPISLVQFHKGKFTDLSDAITQINYQSSVNEDTAWSANTTARSMGDYIYIFTPTPYFEKSEDIYIQQITKSMINVGGLPTDWSKDLGLNAEIVPLTAPYAMYKYGNFRGIVKTNGKKVPFAEVEVEYLNYDIDMQNNQFIGAAKQTYANPIFETLTIIADEDGVFNFTLPFAGFWGFAALGVGEEKQYRGKELSQDAVIWVQAHDVK
jgi:cobalt/nickel transport protein